jgi:hypothetical protein
LNSSEGNKKKNQVKFHCEGTSFYNKCMVVNTATGPRQIWKDKIRVASHYQWFPSRARIYALEVMADSAESN